MFNETYQDDGEVQCIKYFDLKFYESEMKNILIVHGTKMQWINL